MTNNTEIINKRHLCKILTPELVSNLTWGLRCRLDEGYIEREEFIESKVKIEKLGDFCNIVLSDQTYEAYIKGSGKK